MLIIPDLVRKFNVFLKDETVAATLEYLALSAGIAIAVLTAIKPANPSPACRNCGRPLRFVRAISEFYLHPELRIYECDRCRKTVVEEWRPHENATGQLPNSPHGARTVTAGLMVLRKKGGMSNLDIAIMFGISTGSIVFGWKQQSHWLVVPTVVCAAYIAFLICHDNAWAAKGISLARRKILERRSSWLRSPWTLRYVEKSLSLFWAAAGKAANNSKAAITFRASLEKLEDGHFDVPATLSSDDAAELKLSPSAEAQKNMDRVPFLGAREPLEGESSSSTQRSSSPVEMAQDNHREGNSGAGGGIETNNTSWDMARILLGVPKDVEKNSSSA